MNLKEYEFFGTYKSLAGWKCCCISFVEKTDENYLAKPFPGVMPRFYLTLCGFFEGSEGRLSELYLSLSPVSHHHCLGQCAFTDK